MLKCHLCGVRTGHKNGFIHHTESIPHYLIMVFHTPFFVMINGERIEGAPGNLILHRPGSPAIHGPISPNEQFINDWIYFSDDENTIEGLPLAYDKILAPENPSDFTNLITAITEEQLRNDQFSGRLTDSAIYRMLATISRSVPKENAEAKTVFSHFQEIRIQILHQYGEKWTLQKMAALTGYSVSRFSALYTHFFDVSPMNDLLNQRIEMAKQLLALHTYKVSDVAEMCGFSSIHYFSGFMKHHTGKVPSDF